MLVLPDPAGQDKGHDEYQQHAYRAGRGGDAGNGGVRVGRVRQIGQDVNIPRGFRCFQV